MNIKKTVNELVKEIKKSKRKILSLEISKSKAKMSITSNYTKEIIKIEIDDFIFSIDEKSLRMADMQDEKEMINEIEFVDFFGC